jgi:hypothetical protein
MSTRDELAATVEGALDSSHGIIAWAGPAQEDIADAILAAGYSKPRTITTAEELDGLDVGTVVMDGQGEVARKLAYGWRVLVSESGFDAWLSDPLEETYLPAIVLHEPTE